MSGAEDPARGLHRDSQDRIFTVLREGSQHRYCISCRLYFRWLETRERIEQELHTLFVERTPFSVLDTETTGLLESRRCQIVEIAVVNQDGMQVFHSLCKPDIPMPRSASDVSGLTDEDLVGAPPFTAIWPDLVELLTSTDALISSWNADFDREALVHTVRYFQLSVPEVISSKNRWRCAMKLHARWYGEWSNARNDYRSQPLAWACAELGIKESGSHRAVGDAQQALRVLRAIAAQAGKYPPPNEMPSFQRYYGD
ncbi:MAG: 3'-5' exonuclease [Ktedonobacteraceae bacterium]|nr:3'-5' exonuclease [Ktedonobacteraceae bacterium]